MLKIQVLPTLENSMLAAELVRLLHSKRMKKIEQLRKQVFKLYTLDSLLFLTLI